MIPHPDFGDYHRFRVSLAVGMVVAAPVIVWFFLRQPFDLLVAESSIDQLTPVAQRAVRLRQWVSTVASCLALIVSLVLVIVGVRWLRAGSADWKRMQGVQDEILELERDHKKAGLRPLTVDEINQSDQAEVAPQADDISAEAPTTDESLPSQPTLSANDFGRSRLALYREAQELLARKLRMYSGDRFILLTDQSMRDLRFDY